MTPRRSDALTLAMLILLALFLIIVPAASRPQAENYSARNAMVCAQNAAIDRNNADLDAWNNLYATGQHALFAWRDADVRTWPLSASVRAVRLAQNESAYSASMRSAVARYAEERQRAARRFADALTACGY